MDGSGRYHVHLAVTGTRKGPSLVVGEQTGYPTRLPPEVPLLAVLVLALPAFAGGFYHPDDVAAASTRFAEAQTQLMAPLDERQGAARTLSAALREYREGLDLLGDRAPAEQIRRLQEMETDYLRQFDRLQGFADTLVGDFDTAFTGSMERALASHEGAVECRAKVAVGPRVPGMASREQDNPACTGDNLNAAIAAALDADAELAGALPGIVGRTWPNLGLEPVAVDAVGNGQRFVSVRSLMVAGAADALRAIDRADDEARVPIDASLEDGADAAELKALEAQGQAVAATTRARRAELAAPVLAAADAALAKWGKSEGATAWCAQPKPLGACLGDDLSRELIDRLLADKKVAKALP